MEQGTTMGSCMQKDVDLQKSSNEDLIRANKFNHNVEQLVKTLEGEINPVYKNWKDVEDWVTPMGEIDENITYPYVHSDDDFYWQYGLSADDVEKIRVVYKIDREIERYQTYLRHIYRSHIRAIEGWWKDREELNKLRHELKERTQHCDECFFAHKAKAYRSSDTSSSTPWKTQIVEVHNNATCEGCEKCKKEIWGWIFAFLTVNIIQSIIIACLIWC